ncbi:male sterility protein-domain-containing protein [Mycena olivaceomarginata]|nr:male sterility protein-domain-containing protein [Mycena olivaceomarginata]
MSPSQSLALDCVVLSEMAENVTVIIHSAANISLKASYRRAVDDNCLPTLWLAQFGSTFKNLAAFVYISTAYVNGFLPDGPVEERIYELGDAEQQLSDILTTRYPESLSQAQSTPPLFPSRYSFSKNLTERLLISRNPNLPLLIVRPACIAPAISQPHPYYIRPGSCPMSTYIRQYLMAPDSGVVQVSPKHQSGSNIVDEIPVDLVANLILLHTMRGRIGIVHACSQSYVPRSLSQLHGTILAHISPHMPRDEFEYTSDCSMVEGDYARFWGIMGRDWHFSNGASEELANVRGVLSMDLEDHDAAEFMATRARLIAKDVEARSIENKL